MDGLINLKDQHSPQKDLVEKMAQLGYNDTPMFNMIAKGTASKKGKGIDGHQWWYEDAPEGDDTNAHAEGSAPATATFGELGESKNHYQIIKHTWGITGSMEDKQNIEGSNEFIKEGTRKAIQHRKTIEKAMFGTQDPTQRDKANSVAGQMGGFEHWCGVHNTLDTAGDLSIQLLRELFKLGFYNGMPTTHLFMNDVQKDRLDDIFGDKNRGTYGMTTLKDTNYLQLDNFTYAPKVKVILSPYMADDEILSTNQGSLALVFQRLTKSYEIARTSDEIKKELISELTLRVNNPYGVSKLKGLTV